MLLGALILCIVGAVCCNAEKVKCTTQCYISPWSNFWRPCLTCRLPVGFNQSALEFEVDQSDRGHIDEPTVIHLITNSQPIDLRLLTKFCPNLEGLVVEDVSWIPQNVPWTKLKALALLRVHDAAVVHEMKPTKAAANLTRLTITFAGEACNTGQKENILDMPAFSNMKNLEVLRLQDVTCGQVPSDARYMQLKKLISLEIKCAPKFCSGHENQDFLFHLNPSLEELLLYNFNGNRLSLSPGEFANLSSIDLVGSNLDSFNLKEMQLPKLRVLTVFKNTLQKLFLENTTFNLIQGLTVKNNDLREFEMNYVIAPKLEKLDIGRDTRLKRFKITNSDLKALKALYLSHMTSLETVALEGSTLALKHFQAKENRLEAVNLNNSDLSALTEIDLGDNLITSLNFLGATNLSKLETLLIDDNPINMESVAQDLFPQLNWLTIGGKYPPDIPDVIRDHDNILHSLRSLRVSWKSWPSGIEEKLWSRFPNLTFLDAENLDLSGKVDMNDFANLCHLEQVWLKGFFSFNPKFCEHSNIMSISLTDFTRVNLSALVNSSLLDLRIDVNHSVAEDLNIRNDESLNLHTFSYTSKAAANQSLANLFCAVLTSPKLNRIYLDPISCDLQHLQSFYCCYTRSKFVARGVGSEDFDGCNEFGPPCWKCASEFRQSYFKAKCTPETFSPCYVPDCTDTDEPVEAAIRCYEEWQQLDPEHCAVE